MQRNARGFTLIELMVVVAIIAILAAIATTVSGAWRTKVEVAKAVSESRCVFNAVESHVIENGTAPALTNHEELADFAFENGCSVDPIQAALPGNKPTVFRLLVFKCWCQPCPVCEFEPIDCPLLPSDPIPAICSGGVHDPPPPWDWYMELDLPNVPDKKVIMSPYFGTQGVDADYSFLSP